MMDKKSWIIVVLSLVCLVLFYLHWSAPVDRTGEELINQRLDSIKLENQRLLQGVGDREKEILKLKIENNRLDSAPVKIKAFYDTIYEKNKTLPATALASEFERVFAENHID